MTIEVRALPGMEVRDMSDDGHEFIARVVEYDRADSFGSVWAPGCFDAGLRSRRPAFCIEHDRGRPFARTVDHQSLNNGLELRSRFANFEHVPDARLAHSLLSDGIVDGFSVGFARGKWTAIPSTQRSAFGELPARERMHKADLAECSLVAAPSVPGTALVSIRSQVDTGVEIADLDTILRLFDAGAIERPEMRSMLAKHPEYREHITLDTPVETRGGAGAAPDDGSDGDDDAATLAAATDAALDEAVRVLGDTDLTALPDNVQQSLALMQAAGVAVDALLDVMGIEDPDDGDDGDDSDEGGERAGERAGEPVSTKPWDRVKPSDYTSVQYKAACLIKGAGDSKDAHKLPVREPDGTLNKHAVHAAAGRLDQTDAPADQKKAAAKKLLGHYHTLGDDPPGSLLAHASGNRAEVDETVDEIVEDLDAIFERRGVA